PTLLPPTLTPPPSSSIFVLPPPSSRPLPLMDRRPPPCCECCCRPDRVVPPLPTNILIRTVMRRTRRMASFSPPSLRWSNWSRFWMRPWLPAYSDLVADALVGVEVM
ncbi:hypothetical protein PMAYCL1PPCAC_00738, partial [Pristionchus mayeri]